MVNHPPTGRLVVGVAPASVVAATGDDGAGSGPLRAHPDCPHRPPAWRWLQAGLLADGVIRPSRRLDDRSVRLAARFLAALRGCRDEGDRDALVARMPDLHAAYSIYADPDPMRRLSLEAWLLTGEDFAAIAARFGIGGGRSSRSRRSSSTSSTTSAPITFRS